MRSDNSTLNVSFLDKFLYPDRQAFWSIYNAGGYIIKCSMFTFKEMHTFQKKRNCYLNFFQVVFILRISKRWIFTKFCKLFQKAEKMRGFLEQSFTSL